MTTMWATLARPARPVPAARPASWRAVRAARPSWWVCRAGSDSEASPSLSVEDAYRVLGVPEATSFEECLKAKNDLLARYDGNREKCMQVEAAYDRLMMQQLSARLRGDIAVPSKVRFADVPAKRPAAPAKKNILSSLPGGGITMSPPRGNQLTTQAAIFGALAAWTLIQDWAQPPNVGAADVPTLQLALGLAAAVYFLRDQKRAGLGKAFGLATAGLVAGALLGAGVESWLRVDIVPLGGISAPGTVVGEFSLAGLFAAAVLLG